MKKHFSVEKIVAYTGVGFLILASIVFAYTAIVPVDVLKDWSIKTDKQSYVAGKTITLTSKSTKLMSVNGIARRYIECKNAKDGSSWYRTPVNEVDVNRVPGKISTANQIQIPNDVSGLPNTCRLYIVVEYNIYYYRKWVESTVSNEFQLNGKVGQTNSTEAPVTESNPTGSGQLNSNGPSVGTVTAPTVNPTVNSTAKMQTDVDDIRPIDPTYVPPVTQEQPNLVVQLVENINGQIKNVLGLLR